MTIDELVGQLIWAYIDSTAAGDEADIERATREGRVSGVYLMPVQMPGPAEATALVNRFQAAASVPLLVGVDAEAGLGHVMAGATALPTMMALGASGDPALAREAAAVTAAECRACGINTAFAPVVDVNVNPANPIINTRSFGADPAIVSRLGAAFTVGLQGDGDPARGPISGVLATAKHFPGHGDTALDSHLQLGTVAQPRTRLDAVELPPFRAAIAAGCALVMTDHVIYPALDPDVPATLSRPILTDLLRGEMGFEGAVVTDAMSMHAIAHHFDAGEAAVRTVLAGSDLVLTPLWDSVHTALVAAVHEGRLSEARLREAAERVLAAKRRIFGADLSQPLPVDPAAAQATVGTPEHQAIADEIAAASITLARGTIPAPSPRPALLATRLARRFGPPVEERLRAALAAVGWDGADLVMLDPEPDAEQVARALERARAAGGAALLHVNRVTSYNPNAIEAGDALAALGRQVAGAGVPLTVVSLGSPYALSRFERAQAWLCGYSACDASLRAVLRALLGQAPAPGRLPVQLAS